MSEHATCCAHCAAQQLAETCEPCSAPRPPRPEMRWQLLLGDEPRFLLTTDAHTVQTLLVLLSRSGQQWRALEIS